MDEKKQRNTHQRAEVLNAVRNRHDHPCAEDIYLQLRESDPRISRGTVYRNLNLLSKNGDVNHIKVPGTERDRFDSTLDLHYHIMCTACGKVVDVPLDYFHQADEKAALSTGFTVFRHRAVFEGLCPDCQSNSGQSSSND